MKNLSSIFCSVLIIFLLCFIISLLLLGPLPQTVSYTYFVSVEIFLRQKLLMFFVFGLEIKESFGFSLLKR